MQDSRDLKQKYEKSGNGHTYLYWPVQIGDYKDLHITAKYLGQLAVDPKEIESKLSEINTIVTSPLEMKWKPVVFDTKNDGKVKVLQFNIFPENMKQTHDALEYLRKDDYDSYKPHVTVPSELWDKIEKENLQPNDLGMSIHALTLKVKGKVEHIWDGSVPSVDEWGIPN